jgi:hypothetical protein
MAPKEKRKDKNTDPESQYLMLTASAIQSTKTQHPNTKRSFIVIF